MIRQFFLRLMFFHGFNQTEEELKAELLRGKKALEIEKRLKGLDPG